MINKQDVCRTNKVLVKAIAKLYIGDFAHLKMLVKEIQCELNTVLLTTNPST